MKYLYKYPQAAFPYADLVETNRRRNRNEMEYELLDTGVFEDDRYFDVFVEYAKGGPKTSSCASRRSTGDRTRPTCISCRRCGSATTGRRGLPNRTERPRNRTSSRSRRRQARARSRRRIRCWVHSSCRAKAMCRCSSPRTKPTTSGCFPAPQNESPYVKDGINDCVVHGRQDAVNPDQQGTKVAAHYQVTIGAGQTTVIRLRLSSSFLDQKGQPFGKPFDEVFADRLREADEFYKSVTPPSVSEDAANVMRQALAGMLWSKQFFFFDGDNWLDEHHSNPLHHGYRSARNSEWFHMLNQDIISMPDKWEYPWYAAWDLAFHTLPLSIVDPDFAKEQMELMLRGSLPAPERSDPRLRVELQRREPAGPRLCDAVPPSHRAGAARRGGRRFPQGDVQQARAELHLVGQPQGPLRQERVRGRLPRPRQHRRLRPQRPAAHRRPPRTGGRHGVDGPLQPEHAGARGRARRARPDLRGDGLQVRRALLLHRRGDQPARGRTACGTRRMASTTTCCGCPTAAPRGSRCARWSGSSRCAPRR